MSLLSELNTLLSPLAPVETGVFSELPPDRYLVLTPLTDTFQVFADNAPGAEVQEVRISLFDKGNYTTLKNAVTKALLQEEITITDRKYMGYEGDTGYHHYAIDVAKEYEMED